MASDIDGRDLDGVEAELAQLPGDERSAVGGPGLQAVVHSDSPGPQAGPGHLERRRRSEGKGIGPAAAGHEHQVTGREVAHGGAHSRTYGGDCRCWPHAPNASQPLSGIDHVQHAGGRFAMRARLAKGPYAW